jgi:hypothetical protein
MKRRILAWFSVLFFLFQALSAAWVMPIPDSPDGCKPNGVLAVENQKSSQKFTLWARQLRLDATEGFVAPRSCYGAIESSSGFAVRRFWNYFPLALPMPRCTWALQLHPRAGDFPRDLWIGRGWAS